MCLIDRVVNANKDASLSEVPVGLQNGSPRRLFRWLCLVLAARKSFAPAFCERDGTVWTTDKDGPIMDLLAVEITAVTGKDPGVHYQELTKEFGTPYYTRIDAPATPEQKGALVQAQPRRRQG